MKPISMLFCLLVLILRPYKIVAVGGATDLITTACDRTLYKALCNAVLNSDPASQGSKDLSTLDKVVLTHAKSNASNIHQQAVSLHEKSKDDATKQALEDCIENYQDATDQLDESLHALQSKGYDDINTWVTAAMSDADSCEEGFTDQGRKSPLSNSSKTFNHLCSIVLALTNQLKGR
ncbi:Pectinesterase inhibitor [Morella rubra]|uniref:Pectinesterase inhibitor n=1 Tax=Morella rubra TaxID=262757 RepID=A0A6A1UQS5_9ROSI|nr:Pectinesterase inhibitor [Morella rubra]